MHENLYMVKVRSINHNEAITKLPVLLIADPKVGLDGWVTGPEEAYPQGEGLTVIKRHPVRVLPETALDQFANPKTRAAFESVFGRVPQDTSRQLLSMLGVCGAAAKNDLQQVAILAGQAAAATGKGWPLVSAGPSLWDGVAAALNAGLSGGSSSRPPTPVLWQKKESQLLPALLCFDAAQALFAHALFRISGKRGLLACRRCGNPFFASRHQQSFCSYRCRTAEAMKRYRAKLELRESQRREGGGRRTKSSRRRAKR